MRPLFSSMICSTRRSTRASRPQYRTISGVSAEDIWEELYAQYTRLLKMRHALTDRKMTQGDRHGEATQRSRVDFDCG